MKEVVPRASCAPSSAPPGRVVLTGGSGFLGQSLAAFLTAGGCRVTVLTRRIDDHRAGQQVLWDGATVDRWWVALDGADAVVNLAGRSVDCRYTDANRRAILQSRLQSVRAVGDAIARCDRPPPVWIQAASLAIYGDAGDAICDEDAPLATGFSAALCREWEAAFDATEVPSTRRVLLRIGFALGPGGGALEPLGRLVRLGLGGRVGSGRQYISWLHLSDLNRMIVLAMREQDVSGTYNATGPAPATNAEFMRSLRRVLRRPWSPPVPRPLVRLGALLMRTEPELALTGRRCVPRRFLERGFTFEFTDLDSALRAAMHGGRPGDASHASGGLARCE